MSGLRLNEIACEDALTYARSLPDASVDCCLSSPPYYLLRNYGVAGQWGSEASLDAYLGNLWALYDEVRRALKPTGTCFVNLGDTYMNDAGGQNGRTSDGKISSKLVEANRQAGRQERRGMAPVRKKSLMLVPERFALGMVERGWILRNRICWTKPNAMPSSVRDRFACTWEYVWFFAKSERYWSDLDAVRVPHSSATIRRVMQATVYQQEGGEKQQAFVAATTTPTRKPADIVKALAAKYGVANPVRNAGGRTDGYAVPGAGGVDNHPLGRNPGDTWSIPTQAMPEAHFAVWPEEIARRIIRFGCPRDGVAYDPFTGSGTTPLVALQEGRSFVGSELNPEYVALANDRIWRETDWAKRVALPLDLAGAGAAGDAADAAAGE